jgi:hypothetical protein
MHKGESFWDALLFDQDDRQTRAINRMHGSITDAIESQAMSSNALFTQIRDLYNLDRAQSQVLTEMRAMIKCLGELVVEAGVDESVVRYRMEAAVTNAREATEAAAKQEQQIKCAGCGKQVPLSGTNITDVGTVCDMCAV